MAAQLKADVAKFVTYRAADGGITYWAGASSSDPFLTAFAAGAPSRVRGRPESRAPPPQIAQLTPYLRTQLANPGVAASCKDVACRTALRLAVLDAFSEMGTPRSDLPWRHRSEGKRS